MIKSDFLLYFDISNIAEINSLSLIDFEKSLNNFFFNHEIPDFSSGFMRNFGTIKFGEIDNSIMKDFEKSLQEFFYENL